jgi:hypothetical protein
VEDWRQFLSSSKCQVTRKKIRKYENKYKMFHESAPPTAKLEGKTILEAIATLTNHLDS